MQLQDDMNLPGVTISEEEWNQISNRCTISFGERPYSYFERSHNRLYLSDKGNFWWRCLETDNRVSGELRKSLMQATIEHALETLNKSDEENTNEDFSALEFQKSNISGIMFSRFYTTIMQ